MLPTPTTTPQFSSKILDQRVLYLGGVNYMVSGRHGGFIASKHDFYLGQALIRYGEYGECEWTMLRQLIGPGYVIAEIGANIGTHTVAMAKLVGSAGRVVAVEPQRIIHQYLCGNLSINSVANVESYHCGCAERSGMMSVPLVDYFAETRNNFGGVSLAKEGHGEPVSVRALDDIIGLRHVHLIKIGVEGMEADVLRGAKRTIKRCRPVLYVENDRKEKSEELIKLLRHYGYRLYWHEPPLYNPHNFFGVTENIYGLVRSISLLCMPEGNRLDMSQFREVRDAREHPLHTVI